MLGSFRRYNTVNKILSADSWVMGSMTASNKQVYPFTVATSLGFTNDNSLSVSMQIFLKLSSLEFATATKDLAKEIG